MNISPGYEEGISNNDDRLLGGEFNGILPDGSGISEGCNGFTGA